MGGDEDPGTDPDPSGAAAAAAADGTTVGEPAVADLDPSPGRGATDRGAILATGFATTATWGLRVVLVAAGAVVLGLVVGQLWVVVLPVVLALIVSTVLWPPVRWLRARGWPAALASLLVLVLGLGVLAGVVAAVVPPVVGQVGEIAQQASGGLTSIEEWLNGPPLSLGTDQISDAVDAATEQLRSSATVIATGLFSGVAAATSALVTLGVTLVLVFFFLKDGTRFLPWVRLVVGARPGRHLSEVLERSYRVLGGFIRTQAVVSLVDAVFIGLGLLLLGVPLALPLAVFTFLGGFVPIVGAFVAGGLALLVALVSNGPTTALLVLVLILVVQQLEGNVLQPVLQGRNLRLHGAVVLLAVTAGGSLAGVIGAFLAVPVAAVAATVARYVGEQVDERVARGATPDA